MIGNSQLPQTSAASISKMRHELLSLSTKLRTHNDIALLEALLRARLALQNKPLEKQIDLEFTDAPERGLPLDPGDLFPDKHGKIPEISFKDLDIVVLASAMRHHGAIIVRRMLGKHQTVQLRAMIDRTLDAARQFDGRADMPKADNTPSDLGWFKPLSPCDKRRRYKKFVHDTGGVQTLFSPRTSYYLLNLFDGLNLRSLFHAYFSDEPCVSFNKSVLRRVSPLRKPADWHQDGAFMSEGIKSLNLWISLTPCGGGKAAPGIDLVPKRLNKIIGKGLNGANFSWSVSHETVHAEFKDTPPVTPSFNEGDAIIFDHYNLHATSFGAQYTNARYAIETWFFAMQHRPENQAPAYW